MQIRFSNQQVTELRNALAAKAPHLISMISEEMELNQRVRLEICDALAGELAHTGIDENGEVNAQGGRIEILIDVLKPRLAD